MSKNKTFAISDLVNRLEKIANANRYDQVSRIMHEVYEKRMEKNPNLIVSASDIVNMVSEISNFNPHSPFKLELSEVFEENIPITISESSPFRMAGYDEDFRPTPLEHQKTEEEIIKDASFGLLKKIAIGNVTNPQFHFGQFISIPKAGPNSGVALWTVAFNTKRGIATVSVPVNVIAGKVQNPEVFYPIGAGKGYTYTPGSLKNFASEYIGADRQATTELSGFDQIGQSTIITDHQDIKEASLEEQQEIQANKIQLGYTVPVDESLTSNIGQVEAAFNKAIDVARAYVEKQVKGAGKNALNSNVNISYSGALGLDGKKIDRQADNVEGVFAFNASTKTRNGLKTITIPVVLGNNSMEAQNFYTSEQVSQPLTSTNISEYFASNNTETKLESSSTPTDAFTEAFTAFFKGDATYGQIVNEIRASIRDGEFVKGASYLSIINDRFGPDALKQASDDYIRFIKIASEERRTEQNDSFFINSNISFQG